MATTANGKAALSCLDPKRAADLLAADLGQELVSEKQLAAILADIDRIRQGDLARDEDDHTDGISALGFGVIDLSDEVFALSVPVPSSRYVKIKETLITALYAARKRVSGPS